MAPRCHISTDLFLVEPKHSSGFQCLPDSEAVVWMKMARDKAHLPVIHILLQGLYRS
ncbi:MAG: hypothetical protein ACETWT_15420 [Thermodesulfobacteriota bacterium]